MIFRNNASRNLDRSLVKGPLIFLPCKPKKKIWSKSDKSDMIMLVPKRSAWRSDVSFLAP